MFWLGVPYPLSYLMVVGAALLVSVTVTLLTRPSEMSVLREFHARVRPVGAWGPVAGPHSPEQRRQVLAILGGWAGGIMLIYGLLFGVGHWLTGDSLYLDSVFASSGAFLLARCWRPALPPVSANTGDTPA